MLTRFGASILWLIHYSASSISVAGANCLGAVPHPPASKHLEVGAVASNRACPISAMKRESGARYHVRTSRRIGDMRGPSAPWGNIIGTVMTSRICAA